MPSSIPFRIRTRFSFLFTFALAGVAAIAGTGLVTALLRWTLAAHAGAPGFLGWLHGWAAALAGATLAWRSDLLVPMMILFVLWHMEARGNLGRLGVDGVKYGALWPNVAWLVPLAGLWVPFRAVAELWRASEPRVQTPASWVVVAPEAPVKLWWAFGAATYLLGVGATGTGLLRTEASLAFGAALTLGVSTLTVKLVGEIRQRQTLLDQRVGPRPLGAIAPLPTVDPLLAP